MLKDRCLAFREEFTPGAADAHPQGCPLCAEWAEAIFRLREAGSDQPLPENLRTRLRAICPPALRPEESPGVPETGATLATLPQVPLPGELRERLRRIPAERGDAFLPSWARRSRDLFAASCMLALAWTAAVGGPPPSTLRTAASVSRDVTLRVHEAGLFSTRALLEMGDALFGGLTLLNRSMGSLMGRLGPQNRGTEGTTAGRVPPAKSPPTDDKENSHGKRKAPRSGAPRG
jgi:hypothetical protein